jgi:hypothetical protein
MLRVLLTLSSVELFAVTVMLAWIATMTMTCVFQVHTNEAAVEGWSAARAKRIEARAKALEVSTTMEGFFNATIDAVAARRRVLNAEIAKATKRRQAAASVNAGSAHSSSKAKQQQHANDDEKEAQRVERWLSVARRRAMRRGCPKHREEATRFSELLRDLTSKLEITRGETAGYQQAKNMLFAHETEIHGLDAVVQRSREAAVHLEHKMAQIATLWPQWFNEAADDDPIYRQLFADDAILPRGHAAGLREYRKRVRKE